MEAIDQDIERFLKVETGSGSGSGDGDGAGSGSGSGYGDGYGDSYGYGDGYGSGDGSGYGYGSGDGDGDGIEVFNGQRVYMVDDTPTLIYAVKGRVARGAILGGDLSLSPCYVVRDGNYFAHGVTVKDAARDAAAKRLENEPLDARLERFVAEHPDPDKPYGDLFEWHHILTGSCLAGREAWCRDHGYKPTDSITVRAFIDQTSASYGGDIIKKLSKYYKIK